MKKIGAAVLLLVMLTGCSGENRAMEQSLELRRQLLAAEGCSFQADITADYGDSLHSFTLDCQADPQGQVRFRVVRPETIEGIEGSLSADGGRLTFDGHGLYFDYLTDDQLSPISAPWILLRALRSGPITAACREEDRVHLTARDSYEEDALTADCWLEPGLLPVRGELLYRGRRILTLGIRDFRLENAHG